MIKRQIKKIVPENWLFKYKQHKNLRRLNKRKNLLTEAEREMIDEISDRESPPVLFAGHSKSGNTWLRFLIFNYYNIVNNDAEKTLTYSELNDEVQPDEIGALHIKSSELKGTPEGYPDFIRTHQRHKNDYLVFNKVIYISRNPLDVLVSSYHFHIKNRPSRHNRGYLHNDIDAKTLFDLPIWIDHYESYKTQERVLHVTYEQLKRDAKQVLIDVLKYIGHNDINEEAIDKSVELSSFKSIKKMGRVNNQTHGMAPKEEYVGEFTRKGKVNGYKDELNVETIIAAKKLLAPLDLEYNFD